MPFDPEDGEIIAFLRCCYGRTLSDVAGEVEGRFGAERTWPVHIIADYIHRRHRRLYGSRFQRDPEVMAFVCDRVDMVVLDEIVRLGVERFGKDRFPARTTVGRLFTVARARARQEAARTLEALRPKATPESAS